MTDTAVEILSTKAGERSRYRIDAVVYTTSGETVVPTSLKWTLTDNSGNVINSRQGVFITPTADPTPILLYGADLGISGTESEVERVLLIEATYDEPGYPGLPYNKEYRFMIKNFVGVSGATETGNPNYDAAGNLNQDATGSQNYDAS